MPYASVFPLVTARALAREFTYEVDERRWHGADHAVDRAGLDAGRRRLAE